jgi:1-deoxy-D-xylulose-5-phosphate reductoisomerase
MNKGLEVIEAALMFGLPSEQVKVVIHPQSTIHALVQYVDGSLLAHLSHPDMCVPIAQALAYPQRMESGVADLDITMLESLSFAPPNIAHFPCLALAYQALALGQHGCIALNAANEVAVEAFLNHGLAFTDIAKVVGTVLNQATDWQVPNDLDAVYGLDAHARQLAKSALIQSVKP